MGNINYRKLAHLVDLVKKGDSNAFATIYQETYQKVYFFALSIVKNDQIAQDVVQDTFIKVLNSIKTLENNKLFIAWLNRIVYNTSIKAIEKESNISIDDDESFAQIPDTNEMNDPIASVMRDHEKSRLMRHINLLPASMKACIILKYYEEMKEKEIAIALDVPVGTVKSRLNKAKKMLKESIENEGE